MAEKIPPNHAPPSYDEIMGLPSYVNSYAPVNHNSFNVSTLCESTPPYSHLDEKPSSSFLPPSQYFHPVKPTNVEVDFLELERVLHRSSPDINCIISILCHRSYEHRMEIAQKYEEKYGAPLIQQFKRSFSSSFGNLMNGLVIPYYEFLARTLHNSGTVKWLCFILFTVPNQEILEMKSYFKAKYKCKAEKFVKSLVYEEDLPINLTRLRSILRMLEARRDENELNVNEKEVQEDVQKLSSIVGGTILGGSDEEKKIVKEIFYFKSFSHIKDVAYEYTRQNNGMHICNVINKVYPYDVELYLSITNYAINKTFYYATVLRKSVKGLEVKKKLLNHTIVRRFNAGDLMDIKHEFNRQFSPNLRKSISNHTSSNYKYALYALIDEEPRNILNT